MIDEYGGHWITTFSGKKFHFLDPQPEEIDIVDIARALSLTCRFAGQCKDFYSVAQHSIMVAKIVPEEYKLHALLHDASEAYLPDIPRPIKAELRQFKKMEMTILLAILNKFVPYQGDIIRELEIIKEADNIALATEARDLMANTDDWATLPEPLKEFIVPLTCWEVELDFVDMFYKLRRAT